MACHFCSSSPSIWTEKNWRKKLFRQFELMSTRTYVLCIMCIIFSQHSVLYGFIDWVPRSWLGPKPITKYTLWHHHLRINEYIRGRWTDQNYTNQNKNLINSSIVRSTNMKLDQQIKSLNRSKVWSTNKKLGQKIYWSKV